MRRSSPYYPIEFLVECKRPSAKDFPTWFEVIAGFNSDRVALDYAKQCGTPRRTAEGWQYRVKARKGRKWLIIDRPQF